MSIDRSIWKKSFLLNDVPAWPCPKCKMASLAVCGTGTGHMIHDPEFPWSGASDPGTERGGLFAAVLECSRGSCKQIVAVCGEARGAATRAEGWTLLREYTPRYFNPTPPIFQLPPECPDKVCEVIESAFALYWCDPRACVNRIRTAIETLLTEFGIARYKKPKSGSKRVRLSLHDRIELSRAKQPDLADSLMAIKWLGNIGTHELKITTDDALDGFVLLEHVLDEKYGQHRLQITRLAKKLIKRKGRSSH
ncbi:MAG: DUF4145 domain-containing protein [Planctomycetes bacterium]|nr:DUF4145 domain-containing protein [Planctomycetota bacterium]